jgi:hypothetical protein
MNNLWPIYIQTKGRPDCPTLKLLPPGSALIVIEPQDKQPYDQVPALRLVLPQDNMGLPRSRQVVFNHAVTKGHHWYWLMDDDVKKFYRVQNGKTIECPAEEALLAAQAMFSDRPFVAQGALEYSQFAWSNRRGFCLDSYCDVVVAINTRLAAVAKWDASFPLKSDRDFTMQLLAAGYSTMRCATHCFATPKNGSNAGGLSHVYRTPDAERAFAARMVLKWGNTICQAVTKPNGRNDVRVHWRRLSPRAKAG